MSDAIDYGNAAVENMNAGYIIGDRFEELTQLPGVFTIKQFFKALFENGLPKYQSWVVGQGIDASVRYILHLCEKYSSVIHFKYGIAEENFNSSSINTDLEWKNIHFTHATRIEAELKLLDISAIKLLTNDFIFPAARELTEKACQAALPNSVLVIKQSQLQSYHRAFPLPIKVETQFTLMNDNKRSLKSVTRFYQDYNCVSEVTLNFDLYSEEEANALMTELGKKTFESFSRNSLEK